MKNWCQRCTTCASRKTPAPKNCAPLHTVSAGSPMQIIAIDIMGSLPESWQKNSCVLVMADYFTKWLEIFAIYDQEAGIVAQKLVDEVFFRFGIPEQLHCDKGKQFEGNLIKEICKILNISKSRTTSYRPQGDGLVERCNRTLQDMIAITISEHPFDWEEALPKVQMAYNTSAHSTTGYSPFFLMYGREARLPVDIVCGTQSLASSTVDTYAQKSCKLLEESLIECENIYWLDIKSKSTYMTNVCMVILIKLEILSGYWILLWIRTNQESSTILGKVPTRL